MKLIALDLHQDNFVTATLDTIESNAKVKIAKFGLQTQDFEVFLKTLDKNDIVIIESTTNAFWMFRKIQPCVHECYILDVNAVHLRGNKTDVMDAKKLLQILCTFVFTNTQDEMPTVYVPSEEVIKLRALFSTYNLMNKMIIQCKNRIYSLYRQNGLVIERSSLTEIGYREKLLHSHPLGDFWGFQVAILLQQLENLLKGITQIKQAILHLSSQIFKEELAILITIPGVSPFTASAFMSDVCDIERFSSPKKLCAYLKTVPGIKSSNKTNHLGPVPKAGRSLSTTLMTQSILHFKTASTNYNEFYQRLRKGKSAGKCRIALIRKVVTSMYYMLKRKSEFVGVNHEKVNRKVNDYNNFMKGFSLEKIAITEKTA